MNNFQNLPRGLTAFLITALIALCPGISLSQENFYAGKTIRVFQGRNPGGSGDLRVRSMIPFLQKYIPGNPSIVQVYMPGGGGRKAGNFIYESGKPDGLFIGNSGGGMVAAAVLGGKGVKYDLDKMIFLGSPYSSTHYIFLTHGRLGLTNLEKLRAASGVRIGAQSVGHTIYNIGRVSAWILQLKDPKFITGYSSPELDVALLGGEIDAYATADDKLTRNYEWVQKNIVNNHALLAVPKGLKNATYGHLPDLEDFAKTERERKVISMFRNLRLTGSPFYAPPGTPPERIAILERAINKTFSDPAFAGEYKKFVGDDPSPLSPEDNRRAIKELPRDPETVALFNQLAGPGPLPAR